MSGLALAVRFARRELRSGLAGFRIFLAALTLGVAAIAGVGSLGQAFLTGLSEQGRTLLGGDIRLQRLYQPATEAELKLFSGYGAITESAALRTMASDAKNPVSRTLVELKAVDGAYPLIGATELAPALPLQSALACDAMRCGAVAEDALLARLALKPGDIVRMGDAEFVLRARIVSEPDRVAAGFALGPHVLVSREGLERAHLTTPGSLTAYAYRIAFTRPATPEAFRADVEKRFPQAAWEINDKSNALPQVTRFVEQATMFLTLVGLTALIVAGVGAGQAVEAFLERKRATIATLKAMGAEGGQIFLIYLLQIMAVSALGLVLGLAIGAALPFAVEHFFGADIPAPARYAVYTAPLLIAAVFGALAALGFAIPPLARAREIAPAGLFRDLVAPSSHHGRWPYRLAALGAFILIGALSILLSPYKWFSAGFLGGTIGVLIVLRLIAFALRRGLAQLPRQRSQILRLALANLTRPGTPTASIVVALGLGLTLLATVTLTRASVDAQVEDQLPARVPSFFFIDIQQNQSAAFAKLINGFPGSADYVATPILRGRIVRLNGVPVEKAPVADSARWAVNGDRGVTYTTTKPKNANVVEGPDWWPADYKGETLLSFDRDLAKGLGLKIGDTISINIAGREIEMRIFNLRDVDFSTGGVNFIYTVSPGTVDLAPHSFVASVRAGTPREEQEMFAAVSKNYPNVTVVRTKEALVQLGEMLQALSRGIAIASLVTILAGVLVLAGAIAAGHRARLYDAVVLKVLGATRGRLARVYAVEYGLLGALSGVAALAAGTLASWGVAHFVLKVPFVFAGQAVAVTILGGAAATLVLGLFGGFAALSAKPAGKLRNP